MSRAGIAACAGHIKRAAGIGKGARASGTGGCAAVARAGPGAAQTLHGVGVLVLEMLVPGGSDFGVIQSDDLPLRARSDAIACRRRRREFDRIGQHQSRGARRHVAQRFVGIEAGERCLQHGGQFGGVARAVLPGVHMAQRSEDVEHGGGLQEGRRQPARAGLAAC